ncbi:MAG: DUF2232 domain-containing protein [Xanthobacteraceae bacterium]|nr:DUF2232 domain-containing protein [Xanthobacteraceae bacterium]
MIALVLIGLAAGAASALMFTSMISGELISLVLIYLAPLPLMVAAIGWGPLCAVIGGIAATAALGAIFGLPLGAAFAIGVALPGWWLGHLVLLGRPAVGRSTADAAPDDGHDDLEWYPVGRLLLWIVAFATLATFALLLTRGSDAASIAESLKHDLGQLLAAFAVTDDDQVVDALVAIIPICAVIGSFVVLTLNLWLAAKIATTSGRMRRPWPDLRATALPPLALAALCVAMALCYTGGLTALLAKLVTSALMMAYAFAGFAVLHTLTMGLKGRAFWLGLAYAIVVLFVWPVLMIVVLGLADAVFGFRARYLRSRPPPLPAP